METYYLKNQCSLSFVNVRPDELYMLMIGSAVLLNSLIYCTSRTEELPQRDIYIYRSIYDILTYISSNMSTITLHLCLAA